MWTGLVHGIVLIFCYIQRQRRRHEWTQGTAPRAVDIRPDLVGVLPCATLVSQCIPRSFRLVLLNSNCHISDPCDRQNQKHRTRTSAEAESSPLWRLHQTRSIKDHKRKLEHAIRMVIMPKARVSK